MKWTAFSLAAALLGAPSFGLAADCAPLDKATFACQDAIGKAGTSYAKAHLSAVQKCLVDFQKGKITGADPASVCRGTSLASLPTDLKTAGKLTKALTKGGALIAKKCTDPLVASLQLCAASVAGVSTCLFDEHFAAVDQAIGAEFGAVATSPDVALQKCQATIGKESGKYLTARMKAVQKCFKDRNKVCGTDADLPRCLAAQPTGPKAEAKVVAALAKAQGKMDLKIQTLCTNPQIASLDACGDTQADLSACTVCSHGNSAEDQIASEYRAVRSASTATGLQPVADLADDGDTILIQPGTYTETLELKNDGLTVLGHKTCATGDRPLILNTGVASIGVSSCGSLLTGCTNTADDQVVQSLEVNNFIDYDVYTSGAEGVTYRDLVTRGPGITDVTRYGPFPILSNNVLVESCFATLISDAAIYVGQSTNIVVRNNVVTESVAGIEIENSANAEVYGNDAHGNTAGILIFKLPGLPVQLSNCHNIHDNTSTNNNHANYGLGYLKLVPVGTGMLYLSNDTGWFHNNTVTGNGTLGFAAVDQGILNSLNPSDPPFTPPSPDYIPVNNYMVNNVITGNGLSPDSAFAAFASDTLAVMSAGATGNCANGNTIGNDFILGSFASLGACPGGGAAQPPGCPYVPPTTTSSTTTTSTTILSTTTSTTLAPTFTNVFTTILSPKCATGCHDPGNHYAGLVMSVQGTAYTNIVNVPSTELGTMSRITPSDPANSYLQHKVDGTQGSVGGVGAQMPLVGGPLSVAERDLIRAWINAGAPND